MTRRHKLPAGNKWMRAWNSLKLGLSFWLVDCMLSGRSINVSSNALAWSNWNERGDGGRWLDGSDWFVFGQEAVDSLPSSEKRYCSHLLDDRSSHYLHRPWASSIWCVSKSINFSNWWYTHQIENARPVEVARTYRRRLQYLNKWDFFFCSLDSCCAQIVPIRDLYSLTRVPEVNRPQFTINHKRKSL